jgi:hypothetical protein
MHGEESRTNPEGKEVNFMSYGRSNLIDDLKIVIPEIEEELAKRSGGTHGDGSIKQLEHILEELNQILESAKMDRIPEKSKRYTAFSRYVVDEWALDSVLGKKLCALANNYKRL